VARVVTPCPVCAGERFRPVHPGTIAEDDADAAAYFSSSRVRAGYLPVVRCASCGLWMTSPRDDDATLARTYAALEDVDYDREDANRTRMARDHLRFVLRHHPGRGRLLDVGCATGTFARLAREAGFEVTGLEASGWAVERAKQRCPEGEFVRGRVEEVDLAPGGFDVVTLWDTLEHLPAPCQALERLHGWLAPGGWLFVNVPNCESLSARLLGRRWVLLLREHLWYFSRGTLAALLAGAGFEVTKTRPNFVRFSAANVAVRLGQHPGRLGRWARAAAAAPGLRRVALRFPIGEMNAAARRLERPGAAALTGSARRAPGRAPAAPAR
jgi:2-polyprenyl-3-methyl-5-hydroxy-6-metoxy-1,4-benzoquinol methylase